MTLLLVKHTHIEGDSLHNSYPFLYVNIKLEYLIYRFNLLFLISHQFGVYSPLTLYNISKQSTYIEWSSRFDTHFELHLLIHLIHVIPKRDPYPSRLHG